MRQKVVDNSISHKREVTLLQEKRDKDIVNLKVKHQHQLYQLEEELTQQTNEEGEKKVADLEQRVREAEGERDKLDTELKAAIQEKDTTRGELERVCQDTQGVRMENEELEKNLQRAVNQEQEARRVVDELRQKYEGLQNEYKLLQEHHQEVEDQLKVQELERQLKDKEEAIAALQEKREVQLQPHLGSVSPPTDLRTLMELERRCLELETENQKLRVQSGHPIPSNVHHFCVQLSKLVDPEGDSAETTSRPLLVENVLPILQAMGCGLEYKPRGYVIALFNAFNQTQSVLLDYTRIGEVITLKGPNDHLDASDPEEEIEKSPLSSLEGVKLTVTDGNMTDTDKLDVQQLLVESQEQLEKLRVENKDLLERLDDKEVAEVAVQTDTTDREEKAFKDLKAKYLQILEDKIQLQEKLKEAEAQLEQFREQNLDRGDELPVEQWHAEKQQLLEKLEERDAQLKQFREQNLESGEGPPTNHHNVERFLSLDDIISPEDPKAEVIRLRKVLKGKEEEIRNLDAQMKSFEDIAGGNAEEIAQLKHQLKAAQAEIKRLSDKSELVQVYNTLRTEVCEARESLKQSEHDRQDLEAEKNDEISAEKDNNRVLQGEIARLKAALNFYENKYPQADTENILDSCAMEQQDRELIEQILKIEVTDLQTKIRQRDSAVKTLTKCRNALENRLLRLQEERDRLAEQVITLTAVKANLKGELIMKTAEAESLKKEKEMMMHEIKDLQDEIEARKHEATLIREDYDLERKSKEELASRRAEELKKWKMQEQKYQEDLQDLGHRFSHLTHDSEQIELKLTIKLEEKTRQLRRVTENAHKQQREADEQCDQLRQERDSMRMYRDRYKEEREVLSSEFNRTATMYDEKQEECESLQETMEVFKVKCSSLEDCMRKMEGEAMKKEKQFELTASNNRQLENRLQEVNILLTKERQEKEQLLSNLNLQRQALSNEIDSLRAHMQRQADDYYQQYLHLEEELRRANGEAKRWRDNFIDQQKIIDDGRYKQHGDDLSQYKLTAVEPVEDSSFRATGAYGSVSLVRLNGGVKCIEKRLHDILVGYGRNETVSEEEQQAIAKRFEKECILLSKMRHPNIVQFMGVRYNRNNYLSLIMEFLPMSMEKCIEQCTTNRFSIPICYKLSILRDVAYGLLHLHSCKPSVIHRDLSAANILLTSDLRAKIADLGMSRILTHEELSRKNVKLTKAPGAQYIMPPEALEENCQYSSKIDIFSFGIVALYLLLQEFPNVSESGLKPEHVANKEIAIGKLIKHIRRLSQNFDGKIRSVVCACLQDLPEKRPSASHLKDEFERLCRTHRNQHGDTIQMLQILEQRSYLPQAHAAQYRRY